MRDSAREASSGPAFAAGLRHPAFPLAATLVLALLLALTVLRLWVAGHLDFETDETYYWLWSRHLAASYYDHPPMVAYFIRLGTALLGDTILGVRVMALLSMLLASALLYALALILFEQRRVGLLAVLWFNCMPHTTFFSVVMYPDTPAILFWLLTCTGLAMVWRSGRGAWWYLAGAGMGLLLLSKYHGVFLLLCVPLWLVASDRLRFWLKRREPYLGLLLALVLFSPVIVWNARHGWASFAKQFGRALDLTPDGGLLNVAAFVGEQAAFVSPLIFAFIVAGLAVALLRGLRRQEPQWLLLALSSLPVLLYFLVHAFSAEVLAQWPSAAYGTGILAAVAAMTVRSRETPRRPIVRWSFEAAPWLGLVMTVFMCAQMTLRPVPITAAHDPLNRFDGWRELSSDIRAIAVAQQARYIATSDYPINGILSFYLRGVPVFQTSEAIRYGAMPPIDQALLAGTTGLYVAAPDLDDLDRLKRHFDTVEPVATVTRARAGDPIEPFHVYVLKGYRGGLPF